MPSARPYAHRSLPLSPPFELLERIVPFRNSSKIDTGVFALLGRRCDLKIPKVDIGNKECRGKMGKEKMYTASAFNWLSHWNMTIANYGLQDSLPLPKTDAVKFH